MPLIEAAGTSVARIRPDSVKNSTPPERIWRERIGVGAELADRENLQVEAPSVSCLMAAAISRARMFMGWVSGRLLAYL